MLIHGSLNEQLLRSEMEMVCAEAVAVGCAGAANGWMDWLVNRETVLEEMAVIDKSGRFWRADSIEELVDEARRRGGLTNDMIGGLSDQMVQLVGEALAYGDFEPPVIGIAGSGPGAGKDSVADVLVGYGYRKIAWADALKREVTHYLELGITPDLPSDLTKDFRTAFERQENVFKKPTTPLSRRLLQDWGMYRRNQDPDYWVERTLLGPGSVVPGTRFRNEVAAIRAKRGVLLWVENPNVQKCDHPSENDINEQDCDITIMAGVPLDELAESVHLAMRNLRLRVARSSFGGSEAA